MLLGSTLQDTLVFLAASLATAFPIYSAVPMPQQEQFPGPELGKGLGAPCAHPGERRPCACSGLLEPNPRALPGPRPQCPGGFLLSRRHLSFAVPRARSSLSAALELGAVAFPSLSTFAGTGRGALVAAAGLEPIGPPWARSVDRNEAGTCLTAKRINFITYLTKAMLLSKGNTLHSFRSAAYLNQGCLTSAVGTATRITCCLQEVIFFPTELNTFHSCAPWREASWKRWWGSMQKREVITVKLFTSPL